MIRSDEGFWMRKNPVSHAARGILCCGLLASVARAQLTVNEIDYDQVGTDTTEFIEISGPGGMSLTGWELVLYNGSGGTVYDTIDLSLSGTMPVDGLLVVASATVANVDQIEWVSNGVQNGSPDGMVLVSGGVVVELLAYEGSFVATAGVASGMTLPDVGVSESGVQSLSRCPDGSGSFILAASPTPGTSNSCPPPADHVITASGLVFSPSDLTINVGETVLWQWIDGFHTVTEGTDGTIDGDELFNSSLDSGTPFFTFTFTEPGLVDYFCAIHFDFGMTGIITVNALPPPTGACCTGDGSCTVDTQANCETAGNIYQGDGSTCDPNPCPPPPAGTGACCYDGFCTDGITEAACIADFSGDYQGDDTTCTPDPCNTTPAAVVINEVWADDPGTDGVEYVELFGAPGTSLYNLSLLVIDGDTSGLTTSSNYLQVDYQVDFDIADALDSNGFYVLGTLAGADKAFTLGELENTSQNFALVNTADIAYCVEDPGNPGFPVGTCDDIDDDELTPESDAAITANLTDAVATLDSTAGDHAYFGAPIVKDGTFEADFMHRIPNGVDTDTAADWQTQFGFEFGAAGDASSPDEVNTPGIGACCAADGSCSEVSEADCTTAGGTYQGQGAVCDPNPCPQPVGACCDGLGGCTEVTEDDCLLSGGSYQGDGSTCSGSDCSVPPEGIVINEVWADDPGTDTVEYVELYGAPSASLDGLSLIVVDGDTGGNTADPAFLQVDYQTDFTTLDVLDGGGFYLIGSIVGAERAFAVGELENGTQTFALVNTADIAYCVEDPGNPGFPVGTCDDIDPLELTPESETAIAANLTDGVATNDGSAGDHTYFGVPVVQDGVFAADFMHRIPNGLDTDSATDWQTQFGFEQGAAGDASTPRGANSPGVGACCTGESCTVVSESACTNGGGVYQGQGSLCEPADLCSALTGACCITGSCSDLTLSDCTAALGDFGGAGTSCADTDCSVPCTTAAAAELAADDTTVQVCGMVISSTTDLVSSSTVKSFQAQDATGGVTIFGDNASIDALLALAGEGDQIDLVGQTDSFAGLFELGVPFGLSNVVPVGVPAPLSTTVADYQELSVTAETLESQLVVLNGVTFLAADGVAMFAGGVNYNVSSDGGTTIAVVRIATSDLDLVGQVIPTGEVNVTGIFSQFDFGVPADGGYQLLPRELVDIEIIATGACCTGESCTSGVTETDCTVGGGTYQGDGSVCEEGVSCAPTTCPAWCCDGDANGDCQVDPLDVGFILARLGEDVCVEGCAADVNCDGEIDPLDDGYAKARFGTCTAPPACDVGCP